MAKNIVKLCDFFTINAFQAGWDKIPTLTENAFFRGFPEYAKKCKPRFMEQNKTISFEVSILFNFLRLNYLLFPMEDLAGSFDRMSTQQEA